MRSGYDLFGIPVEEHIFMIVVPALVLGMHEALATLAEPTPATETASTHPADDD
jgi:hypothetical protein